MSLERVAGMESVLEQSLENWVMDHAKAGGMKLYFTINGDVPLTQGDGTPVYFEVPVRGKRVCVLHPEHLTRVAVHCYENGVQMVQIMV